jgi:hypothetical protein
LGESETDLVQAMLRLVFVAHNEQQGGIHASRPCSSHEVSNSAAVEA